MAHSSPTEQNFDCPSRTDMSDWAFQMRQGRRWLAGGKPDAAARCFIRAAALKPDHVLTWLDLGAAHLKAGNGAAALDVFIKLLGQDPHLGAARHGEGLARHSLGDRDGSLAAFRRVVKDDYQAWVSWRSLADLTPCEDERLWAIKATARALQTHCGKPGAVPGLFVRCAEALMDAHQFEHATAFILSTWPRFPDASVAYDKLAKATYRRGDFREAFKFMAQALASTGPVRAGAVKPPPPFRAHAALGALRDLGDVLTAHGANYFLAAGTLLGCVRNGGPLAHDRDVDIGLFRNRPGTPDPVDILRDHPAFMLAPSARPGDRYITVKCQGIAIDMFLHDCVDQSVRCGFNQLAGDIQWRLSPFRLSRACFGGVNWNVPDPASRYLSEMYGPRWRRVDKGFASVVSSPALFATSPYARAFYSVARARKCYLSGDNRKARALLRQSPIQVAMDQPIDPGPPRSRAGFLTKHTTGDTPGETI